MQRRTGELSARAPFTAHNPQGVAESSDRQLTVVALEMMREPPASTFRVKASGWRGLPA